MSTGISEAAGHRLNLLFARELNRTPRHIAIARLGSADALDLIIARANAKLIREMMIRERRAGNPSSWDSYRVIHRHYVKDIRECLG
jgi:hypothetical protein